MITFSITPDQIQNKIQQQCKATSTTWYLCCNILLELALFLKLNKSFDISIILPKITKSCYQAVFNDWLKEPTSRQGKWRT